ncbi:cell wall / vacuolar inhibitor of fructosidase 1-like [Actinidia eriantha]|uniref:cell wall / vacuolar inhibitor of fructosidase 1-like n=1 Tax=Actinidia eriantha TaxID=165200 RepID=UPI0025892FE3|nr:cell wall / vacuolar inhibitor of fructosidase 1-like [Actinidia eriantha]
MKSFAPLLFTYLLILLPSSQCSVKTSNDLIAKTCRRTPFSQLCVSTLRSHPQKSMKTVKDLSLVLINIARAKATLALETINKLKASGSNPHLQIPLAKCSEIYKKVLSVHVPKALSALTRGDHKDAEDWVARSAAEAQECKTILIGITNPPQMLLSMGQILSDLFVIIRSIIKSLLGGIGRGHGLF